MLSLIDIYPWNSPTPSTVTLAPDSLIETELPLDWNDPLYAEMEPTSAMTAREVFILKEINNYNLTDFIYYKNHI